MLYAVLALVLAAFGLLIVALTTANTLWAWLSVVVSVAAAGLLVMDWMRNRRAAADRAPDPADEATAEPRASSTAPASTSAPADRDLDPDADPDAEPPEPLEHPAHSGDLADSVDSPDDPAAPDADGAGSGVDDPDGEPAEEATDAADLLIVSDLATEVRVVDERPRYHLAKCGWLGGRGTLPLPVSEARQLGFTPCAVCGPDAALARRHREGRGAKRPGPVS